MNLKFSQFKYTNNIKDNDLIPIVRSNDNFILSALSIFNYLSGSKMRDLYTSYQTYSSLFLSSNNSSNSVFTTFSNNSALYVTRNTAQSISGVKTFFDASNFRVSLSSVIIYTPNGNSNQWNLATSYVLSNSASLNETTNVINNSSSKWNENYNNFSQLSSIAIVSDTSYTPSATAIKNIISLTQVTYDNLLIKDPYTFYIIS
jgi:hypothetical protein